MEKSKEEILNENLTYGADTYDAGQRGNILKAMQQYADQECKTKDEVIRKLRNGFIQIEMCYGDHDEVRKICQKMLT